MGNFTWIGGIEPDFTTILGLFDFANTATGNLYGLSALVSIFIVSFLALKRYPTEQALAGSSFLTAIVSYMMVVLGWIGSNIALYPTVILVISVFLLVKKR